MSAVGSRILLETRAAGPDTSLGITVRLGVARMLDRRTQRMVLSASIKHLVYRDAIPDPRSMFGVSDVEKIVADGEGEEVVGRRRSHLKPTCSHLTHSVQEALSALGWCRCGRWCRRRARSSARRSGSV